MSVSGNPTDQDREQLRLFIETFVPKSRRERWHEILGGKPRKWAKLSMDDLFRAEANCPELRTTEIEGAFEALNLSPDSPATLFSLPRPPYVSRGSLGQLVQEGMGTDALIIVEPGKLAFASHHSDGWLVCQKD